MKMKWKRSCAGMLAAVLMLTSANGFMVHAEEMSGFSVSGGDGVTVSGGDTEWEAGSVSGNGLLPAMPRFADENFMMKRIGSAYIPSTAFTDKAGAGVVTFDGKLEEDIWSELPYEVDKRIVSTTLNNTCAFSTAWDETYFYVAVAVKDEDIVTDFLGDDIYQNDGVEIFIDPDHDGVYDERTAHFMLQVADGAWTVWGGSDKWDDIKTSYSNSDMKYSLAEGGYTVELKVAFSDMGINPESGTALGMAVCNNDNDDKTKVDRQELHWVENFSAGNATTWGSAYLNSDSAQMIAWPGTVQVDGILDEDYEWQETTSDTYTLKTASLCDSEYLYLAYDVTMKDANASIADILSADTSAEFRIFLSGDNDQIESRSPNNHDLDFVIKLSTGTVDYFRTCDADAAQEDVQYTYCTNEAIMKFVDNGATRSMEIAIPWEKLNTGRNYLTTIGMETVAVVGGSFAKWSNAPSPWKQSKGYGGIVLNNKNVAASQNTVPSAPNQINSFSIPQGGSVNGKIAVKDADGDKLTHTIVEPLAEAGEGTFTLNSETGEWSYTTPNAEFTKPDGVNYYVETSDGAGGKFRSRVEIRVEHAATNVIWHVDGDNGSDSNDGRTKETAFKTLPKAHEMTNPGDTILIYDSEVPYGWNEDVYSHNGFQITRSGLPDAYITYKAAPGNTPILTSNGEWNTIYINASYIKIEGLRIEGIAEQVGYEEAWKIAKGKMVPEGDPEYIGTSGREVSIGNTNGLSIMPIKRIKEQDVTMDNIIVPHHIEVRNCMVNGVSAAGLSAIEADYITFENNTITNCGYWEIYAGSGISALDSMDIDSCGTDNYKMIIRNNVIGGVRHFMPWAALKRLSDGNGIIVDSNNHKVRSADEVAGGYIWGVLPYEGRTLVANNLCYENGGSGIHVFDGNHVDLINNTVYSNGATTWLGYSDFYANSANDINMFNNIVYSRSGNKMNISSSSNQQIVYDNNLFYNYNEKDNNLGISYKGTIAGSSNLYRVDPMFTKIPEIDNNVDVSSYPPEWTEEMKTNAENARYDVSRNYDINQYETDFTLQADSPALHAGNAEWSAKVGNTDNRLGVFGTIGAVLESDDSSPEEPDTEEPEEPDTEEPEENENSGGSSASQNSDNVNVKETKKIFEPVEYIVVSGDTLGYIARCNGLSLTALLALNPQIANPNRIYPGQKIILGYVEKSSIADAVNQEAFRYYIVRTGDSFSKIARRHNMTLKQLVEMNMEIAKQRYIYAGQRIRVTG